MVPSGATTVRRYWIVGGLLIAGLVIPASADSQNCSKGKPCGNTCIARAKVCRVGQGSARWAPGPDTTSIIPQGVSQKTPAADSAAERVFSSRPAAKRSRCVVASITDGDTFRCADGQRVRLLLTDAPERGQGTFGTVATSGLRELIGAGDEVVLEFDVVQRDRYGRTLAYVYASGGAMVNEEMARRGLALLAVYPPNVKYVERIRAAAAEARAEKRGLWTTGAFACTPADHRRGRC